MSDSQITWSRTFSGMEILTNPTLHLQCKTNFILSSETVFTIEDFKRLQEHIRPTSDPIANAASSLNVTVNNASMSITPARDHRIVTSYYPDEKENAHQRKHYGLNQLDQFAESKARTFERLSVDDVERQHNTNALRDNYPQKWFGKTLSAGDTYTAIGLENFDMPYVLVSNTEGAITADLGWVRIFVNEKLIGYIRLNTFSAESVQIHQLQKSNSGFNKNGSTALKPGVSVSLDSFVQPNYTARS